MNSNYDKIGCIIINFLRPEATIKCINSLLKQCPDIQVYLGDQDTNSNLERVFPQSNIHYCPLPFDCGISYARNTLITKALAEGCEYFMWADNDFIFDNNLNLDHPLTILKTNRRIGVVGGSMRRGNATLHYERFMYYDRENGILTYVPIAMTHPEIKEIDGVQYYDCDITFNFVIAKKDVWTNERVRWNENIKVKFEHSTWFLQLQRYSKYKAVYCPSFSAEHCHVETPEYHNFRFRNSDEVEFARFFKLKCMFVIGEDGRDFVKQTAIPEIKTKPIPIAVIPNKIPSIQKQQPLQTEILNILSKNHIVPVLLKDSCKAALTNKLSAQTKYYLGFTSENDLQTASKLIPKEHNLSLYKDTVKNFHINNLAVLLPCPVTKYLTNLYGKGWPNK